MRDHAEAAVRRMIGRGMQAAGGACADVERMAAYLEGALTAEEHRCFEEHASSCGDCLEVLGLAIELAAAPGGAEPTTAGAEVFGRKTIFRVSIPLAVVAMAAVVIAVVVGYRSRDAGVGPVQISEASGAAGDERTRPLPLPRAATRAPALSHGKESETPAADAAVIRAMLAASPQEQAAAPAAGRAAQGMHPERAEGPARCDLRAPPKVVIEDRTFRRQGAFWVDGECLSMPGAEVVEIGPESEEYREILASYPGIRGLLGGGESVVLCRNGRIFVLR